MRQDTRDIARGALVNYAGTLVRSVSVVFYVYLARVYGAAAVGVFVLCNSGLDIVAKLGILGFDRAIMTMGVRRTGAGDDAALYRVTAQGLAMAAAAAAAVTVALEAALVPLTAGLLGRADLATPLRIMAPGVFFWTVSAVLLAAARATRVMKNDLVVKSAVEPLTLFAAALLLRPLLPGVEALAWAFLASTFAGAATAAALFVRTHSLRRLAAAAREREGRGELLRHAAPIGLYDLLNLLLQRVDLFILNRFAPAATVGVYALAQNAAFTFKRVRQGFDPISLPVIAAAGHERRHDDLLGHYRTVTRWVLIINLGLLGAAIAGARLIMGIFGDDFAAGAAPLVILTTAIMVNTVLGVSELFILTDRPALNVANTLVALLAAAGLGLLLAPRFGMVGAACSILGAYSLMNLLRLVQVRLLYRMHPFTIYHLRAAGAFLAAGAATLALRAATGLAPSPATDAASIAGFLALYAGALALLGLAAEERSLARRCLAAVGFSRGSAA